MKVRLFFILVFFLFDVRAVFGCLCDTSITFVEAFNESTAVFSGKYIGSEYRKGIINELLEAGFFDEEKKKPYEILVLKFQVELVWKGATKKEIVLLTNQARFSDGSTSVSDCDLSFKNGERYLIFAYGENEDNLQTNACSRTARLKRAKNDLKLLGSGKKPVS